MNWERAKLGDIAEFGNGLNFGKEAYSKGIKFIGVSNFRNRFYPDYKELEEVKEDIVRQNDLLADGDIVFVRSNGNKELVGRCMLIQNPPTKITFSGFCIRARLKDLKKHDPVFWAYHFKNQGFRRAMSGTAIGANIQNLSQGRLAVYEAEVPDIGTQHRIANVLSTYDKLIHNNEKQIKLLEEAAQRLYKEWFVDLRFPGYENCKIVDGVPEGWKKDKADCFFNITIGKTPPRAEKQWFVEGTEGIPWLSISDMGNSRTYVFCTNEGLTDEAVKKHNVKVVPAGTVFVSFKLTIGRVAIATTDMCTNEAIAHFYIDDVVKQAYTYCYLRNFEYDTLGNTSSISKAVNSKIIKAMPFIMPTDDIVQRFSVYVAPILNEIKNKQRMCIKSSQARDRLLPKLMSGEIEVLEEKS